jgi:hypothetical protein
MYNLLTLIPNYGIHQRKHLDKILKEYESFKQVNVSVVLFSTDDNDHIDSNLNIQELKYNINIGTSLSLMPREYIFNLKFKDCNFDLFMHQENDTLITEDNILAFIQGQYRINSDHLIHGFIRYEEYNGEKYLIDMHKNNFHEIGKVNNENKLIVDNVHQGGWIITKNQLLELKKRELKYGSTLEDSCSNFYKSNKWPGHRDGLEKFIFKDLIEASLIHHLPNKYISTDKNYLSIKELMNI